MTDRTPSIHRFLTLTAAAIRSAGPSDGPALRAAGTLTRVAADDGALAAPQDLPVCRHLGSALDAARSGPAPVRRLADAIEALRPHLAWRRRAAADPADTGFFDRHANVIVLGPGWRDGTDGVRVGISLLAPGTPYPDHHHPPEEVYLALSPGEWRQADGPWREPGIGGLVHNPPDIRHAMRSGTAPLLAVWCLWTDA